jgi:hypothetical protein
MLLLLTQQRGLPQLVRSLARATATEDSGVDLGALAEDHHYRATGNLHLRLRLSTAVSEHVYAVVAALDKAPWTPAHLQAMLAADVVVLFASAAEGLSRLQLAALRALSVTPRQPHVLAVVDSAGDADLFDLAVAELGDACADVGLVLHGATSVALDLFIRCGASKPTSCADCEPVIAALQWAALLDSGNELGVQGGLLLPSVVYEKVSVTQRGRLAQPVPFGLLTAGGLALGDTMEVIGGSDGGGKPLTVRSIQIFGEPKGDVLGPVFVATLLDGAKPRQVGAPRVLALQGQPLQGHPELQLETIQYVDWGGLVPGRIRVVTPGWSQVAKAVDAIGPAAVRLVVEEPVVSLGPAVVIDDNDEVVLVAGTVSPKHD